MKPIWVTVATCICLIFVASALSTLRARGDSTVVTLQEAIEPYLRAIGRDPDEVRPGSRETLLLWGHPEPFVLVVWWFEKTGWGVVGMYQELQRTVPSEWALLWALAEMAHRDCEIPTDPWGRPITDMNVLHPEQRW